MSYNSNYHPMYFLKRQWPVYLSGLLNILIIFLTVNQLTPRLDDASVYIVLLLITTINSWIGGMRYGFFSIAISVFITLYYFVFLQFSHSYILFNNSLKIILFLVTGIAINVIIEKYKQTNLVNEYEEKLEKLKKYIKNLEAEREKMQIEIKSRDEFLSIASHELKTPLTSMLLKIQMLLHSIRNVSLANFSVENLLKQLETAEQQTQRLSLMINDLLNVSLITTGKLHLELSEENFMEIVKEVVNEFSEKLEKEGIPLLIEGDEDIMIKVDKLRMEQVITNLVMNAIKYGNGKPIDIKVRKNNHHAKISITDYGIGIASDQKERIFNLFERGIHDNSVKGLGVGLYIARQIVKAHQGSIHVDSDGASGSTFTVELPISQ